MAVVDRECRQFGRPGRILVGGDIKMMVYNPKEDVT